MRGGKRRGRHTRGVEGRKGKENEGKGAADVVTPHCPSEIRTLDLKVRFFIALDQTDQLITPT